MSFLSGAHCSYCYHRKLCPNKGDDCTATKPTFWKRLTELSNNPTLFKDGIGCGDIKQGSIGTCWLLGAIGSVAGSKPERLEKLFCEYDTEVGVYGLRFCIDGEWMYVIVDDFMYGTLPYLAANPR
jgi:hypothetical protein